MSNQDAISLNLFSLGVPDEQLNAKINEMKLAQYQRYTWWMLVLTFSGIPIFLLQLIARQNHLPLIGT